MEATYFDYVYASSIDRLSKILDASDNSYEDKNVIPSRSLLTYDNGFYVDASIMFVDLRNSTGLTDKHKRPTLAKIYRSYIQEVIAVCRGNPDIQEIYIEGDGVWAVFNTPFKSNIDGVFTTSGQVSSIIDILNIHYKKRNYSEVAVGIGLSYGSSLYIKAGHKGSGINEIVWLGKVVGEAAHLGSYGNKTYSDCETMVSNPFYDNLNADNRALLCNNYPRNCYHGNIINIPMNEWVIKNG